MISTGIKTNGIGQVCTSHLNLTVTMAGPAEPKPAEVPQPQPQLQRVRIQGCPPDWKGRVSPK